MTPTAFVLFALTVGPNGIGYENESDADALAQSERAFAEGETHRGDSLAARQWFRDAARGYDDLWRRGCRNPALARNRARAHRLAGDLPGAIAALHDGLAVARFDRSLQVELEDARAAVSYPLDGELAALCRPRPVATVGTRMAPAEAYFAAGLLWLLACLAAVRFAMTRNGAWVAFGGLCVVCLLLLGGLWLHDRQHQTRAGARPLVIVGTDALLRKGNGDNWEPRLPQKLPRGVEARELARRGGWVQVELADGVAGWLPSATVMSDER